ncbi:unnamed protein product [Ixodes pacificus]
MLLLHRVSPQHSWWGGVRYRHIIHSFFGWFGSKRSSVVGRITPGGGGRRRPDQEWGSILSGVPRAGACLIGEPGQWDAFPRVAAGWGVWGSKRCRTCRLCFHCMSGPGSWVRPSSRRLLVMTVEEDVGSLCVLF